MKLNLRSVDLNLLPVLQALCRWGNKHLSDTIVPPDSFMKRKVASKT